ncbi:hypothetical protein GALMADRAFT_147000 [Galerina marginata CBS 339.88]|uniref:Uncharacterized protein n=1 Tax=Galerina marginata (strain CBS 339.88) TaxID=685588 RepID=A0A067SA52_GALM3|nr:hypothetical protein GALMADRAFT_147000 [Galerina marginata CBS 339.88]
MAGRVLIRGGRDELLLTPLNVLWSVLLLCQYKPKPRRQQSSNATWVLSESTRVKALSLSISTHSNPRHRRPVEQRVDCSPGSSKIKSQLGHRWHILFILSPLPPSHLPQPRPRLHPAGPHLATPKPNEPPPILPLLRTPPTDNRWTTHTSTPSLPPDDPEIKNAHPALRPLLKEKRKEKKREE